MPAGEMLAGTVGGAPRVTGQTVFDRRWRSAGPAAAAAAVCAFTAVVALRDPFKHQVTPPCPFHDVDRPLVPVLRSDPGVLGGHPRRSAAHAARQRPVPDHRWACRLVLVRLVRQSDQSLEHPFTKRAGVRLGGRHRSRRLHRVSQPARFRGSRPPVLTGLNVCGQREMPMPPRVDAPYRLFSRSRSSRPIVERLARAASSSWSAGTTHASSNSMPSGSLP